MIANRFRYRVRASLCAILLTCGAGMTCVAAAGAPDAGDEEAHVPAPATFDLSDPARIAVGRRRFDKICAAYCHGKEGVGGRAPDFKGRKDLSAEDAYKTIFYGRRNADVMPPWGEAFTSDQIWELVAYIKFLGTQ